MVAGAGFEPTTFGLWARRATRLLHPAMNIFKQVAEEKGFEPLRRSHDLPVFKTGPFNQTWVFLQQMVPKVGLEPTRGLNLAGF